MTKDELKKIIRLEYRKQLTNKDSAKANEVKALWNEVDNANFENPAAVDTWVNRIQVNWQISD